MSDAIRVALFGNGFARSVMLPALRRVEGVQAVGIASPNLERARETAAMFGIEAVSTDHRELLDQTRPDLVFVATPPHRHAEMAIDALAAGCHVVCEKPTALNAEESARMLSASRARPDRLALIDHELRFLPTRLALRELTHHGDLGEIYRAAYTLHSPGQRDPSRPWSWWNDRDQGGGALGAIGSHAVDSLRVLLGEVREAAGHLDTWIRERTVPANATTRPVTSDDAFSAWLRFESGVIASIEVSTVEWERRHSCELNGSLGVARVDEQRPLRAAFGIVPSGEAPAELPVLDDLPPSAELEIPDTDWARAFLRMARVIAGAIRAGETSIPGAATFEDGHRNQLVLDAIRRADRERGWVRVQGD